MKEEILAVVHTIHLVDLRDHGTDAQQRRDVRVVIWLVQHRLWVLAKPYQRRLWDKVRRAVSNNQ